MTKIEYKPHCGKCGALINEEVTYAHIINESSTISNYSSLSDVEINPWRCSYCGEIFNLIEIKMPKEDEDIRIK